MEQKSIPYGRHHVTEEDIQAVHDTLLSDYLAQGPRVEEFEKKFAAEIAEDLIASHVAGVILTST